MDLFVFRQLEEDNTSIGFQTEKIEGYSKLHDLELKDVFVDVMSD